ncbi:TolC family protein [Flavobacterium hibernum]|uniref:Transporter n=1 Tax=Flavobacterium hibernum TaxID=37752 RepID=A0A0D0F5E1_9FLAO|nr:TolC family protein [Flavobacterium hibernum]KIO53347.1 transporter [Flavobacterium hibernum]OXA87947.1 transporter [Flavobacterium hibernum]STO10538.1 multidrug resistance outer membrane protein MdtQ [Flavobacterium hibernum]
MKINQLMLFGIFFIGISSIEAQEKTSLTLGEAVKMAWEKSNEVTLANTKVNTKKYELKTVKDNQYPDIKVSGQYQRLTKASISMPNQGENASLASPDRAMLGMANLSLPLFAGFKIQNSIDAYDNLYEAENANAAKTKEDVALRVITYYTALYKAQKTLDVLIENQKSAKQRVTDFTELEKNGIIPRNDLLKSQLLVSKTQLSIDEATNNLNNINFYLTTLLKLDPNTKLQVNEDDFFNLKTSNAPTSDVVALENRKDLEAIRLQQKASESNIKVAKAAYYPTLALLGGYTALDLKDIITVKYAMNFGLGLSYDLSGIYKNSAHVKVAESKALEVKNTEAVMTDRIKVEVQKSIEDYDLAINQSVVYDEALQQASENYRLVKDKFDNGLSDTNDLVEADVEQLSAKINTAVSKATIIQKYYELLSVSGQLSQSFNLSKI